MTRNPRPDIQPSGILPLDQLRASTRDAHQRLDTLHALSAPDFSLNDYVAVLRAYHQLHRLLEARIAPFAEAIDELDWPLRRKTRLLERDLMWLGAAPLSQSALDDERLPVLACEAAALGCLYVLEGSTLGGRLLGKRVRDRLGLDADRGAAFLNGYGERTGEMWRRFISCLSRIESNASRAAACEAARKTFDAFESGLGAYGALRVMEHSHV